MASFTMQQDKRMFDPVEPRIFLRETGESFLWMDPCEWKPLATVESCFISGSRGTDTNKPIRIFNPNHELEYEQHRDDKFYKKSGYAIFRTRTQRNLVKHLAEHPNIHPDYLINGYWPWVRNDQPKGPEVETIYGVGENQILRESTSKKSKNYADKFYGKRKRVIRILHWRLDPTDFTTVCPSDKTFGDCMYMPLSDDECDSYMSANATILFKYTDTLGRYSRGHRKQQFKYTPNLPLDRIWTDDKIIDYFKIPLEIVDGMYKDLDKYNKWFRGFV